jgi:glycosyltransferase involved in cell wall biosynthesis
MHSYLEDLELSKIPFEIIVATNCCTDQTPDILLDKYRRWVREGILKVVEFNDRPSHWGAANAGIEASIGKYVVVSDSHMSIKYGTMARLHTGAKENGGIWFAAEQQWNDTRVQTYQYDLKLWDSMWGYRCRFQPPGNNNNAYKIGMAPHCLLLVSRDEVDRFGAYTPPFATYGGGEPYLCLKWWMMGSSCWIDPQALSRHAFGWRAEWVPAKKDHTRKSAAYTRDGLLKKDLKKGEEHLSYSKGYSRGNYEYFKNFALAAYALGGPRWLTHYLGKAKLRSHDAERMRKEVIKEGTADHLFIKKNAKRTLDDLIQNPPWKTCEKEGHGDGDKIP